METKYPGVFVLMHRMISLRISRMLNDTLSFDWFNDNGLMK